MIEPISSDIVGRQHRRGDLGPPKTGDARRQQQLLKLSPPPSPAGDDEPARHDPCSAGTARVRSRRAPRTPPARARNHSTRNTAIARCRNHRRHHRAKTAFGECTFELLHMAPSEAPGPPSVESAPPPAERIRRPSAAVPRLQGRPRRDPRASPRSAPRSETMPSGSRSIDRLSKSSVVGTWTGVVMRQERRRARR